MISSDNISKATLQERDVAGTLAWAARHEVDFARALESMINPGPAVFAFFKDYLSLSSLFATRRRIPVSGWRPFFNNALKGAVYDLDKGMALNQVLEKHLHWWLPSYYMRAVREAEVDGNLPEVLASLYRTSSQVNRRRKEVFTIMIYPLGLLLFSMMLLKWNSIFILPKFKQIFNELLEGEALPALTEFFFGLSNISREVWPIGLFIMVQLPFLFYIIFCTHKWDRLLARLPFFGGSIRCWAEIEAARCLAHSTAVGETLPQAFRAAVESSSLPEVQHRMQKISEVVENGGDWLEAWRQQYRKEKMADFYLSTAAASGDLSRGFIQWADWLQQRDHRRFTYRTQLTGIAVILSIGLFMLFLIIAMFMPMVQLMYKM